jgi:hypothetical protein
MIVMNEERKAWGDWSKELYGQEPLRDIGSNREMMTKAQFLETVRGQTFTVGKNCNEPDERSEIDRLNTELRKLHQKNVELEDEILELKKIREDLLDKIGELRGGGM